MDYPTKIKILLLLVLVSVAIYLLYSGDVLHEPLSLDSSSTPVQIAGKDSPQRQELLSKLGEDALRTVENYLRGVRLTAREDTVSHAISLDHDKGRPAINQGDYSRAYDIYRKILAISYNHTSLMGLGISIGQIATIQKKTGNRDAALTLEFAAYKITEAMNNPAETGVAAMRVARALDNRDRQMAIQWRLKALDMLENTPHRQDYIYLLQDLAKDYRYLGDDEEGYKFYEAAYRESQSYKFKKNDLYVKYYILRSYVESLYRLERCPEIIDLVNTQLPDHHDSIGINKSRLTLMHYKGYCQNALQLNDMANIQFLETYHYYKFLRGQISGDKERANFDKNHYWIVNAVIEGLIENDQVSEAMTILESHKAPTLTEILGDKDYLQQSVSWDEISQRQNTEVYELANKYSEMEVTEANVKRFSEQMQDLHEKHNQETLQLNLTLGSKKSLRNKFLHESDITSIQKKLDESTKVLSYFVGNDNVGVFVVDSQSINYLPLDISASLMKKKVKELQVSLQNPANDFYIEPSEILYEKLIAPLGLKKSDNIIYIPDDSLAVIPLGVLGRNGHFIEEDFNILRLPSLRYFDPDIHVSGQKPAGGVVCVDPAVENARLPHQLETGKYLETLYGDGVTKLTDKRCTIENLRTAIDEADKHSFLHVGAHGFFYTEDPMRSGIMLASAQGAPYEYWAAQGMAATDFSHLDLVTLSSCETGMISLRTPRDVFGTIRALYFGGAKHIIAPLWAVQADTTSGLMQEFYGKYSRNGSITGSMTEIKRSFINSEDYHHPFYWAAFVITGGPA